MPRAREARCSRQGRSVGSAAGWLAALLWLCLQSGVSAQPVLRLSDLDQIDTLAAYTAVLEDPAGTLTLSDIQSPLWQSRFAALGERSTSFGLTGSAWWLRLELGNDGRQARHPVLRQSYAMLDHLEVWVLDGDRIRQHWRTGDRLPFSSRPIEHRDFLFPLRIPPGSQRVIYLRGASDGPVNLPLSLYSEAALLPSLGGEQLALGALLGSFLLLAVCIVLLYLFVRDVSFLYYFFYVLSYGSYMAFFNGVAYQYVWPDSPDFASWFQVVLLMSALFFLLQFSRVLLRIALIAPRLDWVNRSLQALVLAVLLAAPVFEYAALIRPISLATLWTMAMVVLMGVLSYRAGQATARYYLLAWTGFVLGVVIYMLKSFGWLPHSFLTQYGFQIGTVLEFVLLSVALSVRVQELKQQSRTDALTGLGNRARFDELIDQHFEHSGGLQGPLSLLLIDVDHFKRVNDLHGHDVGDRVLQRVADVLRRDATPSRHPCRYGGEEFAMPLPRCALDEAFALANRLREQVAAELGELKVTISIGVACTSGNRYASARALFRAADEALYAAKSRGRNCVTAIEADPSSVLQPMQLPAQPP